MEDPILFWNAVALELNRLDHTGDTQAEHQRGPTRSSRALALVHLAMHDAFFAVNGVATIPGPPGPPKQLYLLSAPGWTGGNSTVIRSAAVSGAAATALCTLYSGMRALIEGKLAEISGANGTDDAAFSFGRQIAWAVFAARSNDDVTPLDSDYSSSPGALRHRVDPYHTDQGYLGVAYGQTPAFAVTTFHTQAAPPAPTSTIYQNDFDEVRTAGGAPELRTTTRTPDQTLIGLYWAYDGAMKIGTPPRLYNQIARKVAEGQPGQTTADYARLFALINCAMADAGVHAWHYKYCYDLWRPIIGIREHDPSTGPAATSGGAIGPQADPFWKPLGAPSSNEKRAAFTPHFPAYPSGHATFGAATFEMVRQFYGHTDTTTIDSLGFTFVSDELNGITTDADGAPRTRHVRTHSSMAQAMYDNSISRIYLGVHWRFDGTSGSSVQSMLQANDDIGGVPLGRAIARDIFNSGMREQAVPPTAPTGNCI